MVMGNVYLMAWHILFHTRGERNQGVQILYYNVRRSKYEQTS